MTRLSRWPKIEFADERDACLRRGVRERLLRDPSARLEAVFVEVARSPAPRFWVSEERALWAVARLLSARQLGRCRPCRRRMFHQIADNVRVILAADPDTKLSDAVWQVVNGPAPEHFVSPATVKAAYYAEFAHRPPAHASSRSIAALPVSVSSPALQLPNRQKNG